MRQVLPLTGRRKFNPHARLLSWIVLSLSLALVCLHARAFAADQPQWGERYSRNMVSQEKGLPESFDPAKGTNVKWCVSIGTECYASPVIADGRVYIGANNGEPYDPRHQGDRGVLLCLRETDGSLLWQLVVPKLEGDVFLDWPKAGLCSPATVEGDRVYIVTNRAEVLCLDAKGQANGNDGPYLDEGRHMAIDPEKPMEVTPLDADILWRFDMRSQAGVYPHDAAHSSILLDGDYLYLNTGNGVDNTHRKIRAPEAPSLIVLDKRTGRLVARDNEHIGPRIFHCTWSSPALGVVGDKRLIFFGGGDGVAYAFQSLGKTTPESSVAMLQRVWRFDCDPTAPKENVHRYVSNRKESPSNIKGMPVFVKDRVYVAAGGDIWWGKPKSWLKCIDVTRSGDITSSGEIWSAPLDRHCCSTPSVVDDLVFIADCGGKIHCLDAATGKPHWVHDTGRETWSSTLVADGKVYLGNRRGDLWVLAASKEKREISRAHLDDAICGTPVAANGVLYVPTLARLYALQEGAKSPPRTTPQQ